MKYLQHEPGPVERGSHVERGNHGNPCILSTSSNTGNLSSINEIRFCKRLGEFAARWAPFRVNFGSIGAFAQSGATVFLTPAPSEDLLMIHRHFHCSFDDFEVNEWEYYKPSLWVPHCTLSTNIEDSVAPEVIGLVLDKFRPFPVEIAAASLVRFQPQYA